MSKFVKYSLQEDLQYSTKDEQAQLLSKVLAASDADAEEEQISGVDWAKKSSKVTEINKYSLIYILLMQPDYFQRNILAKSKKSNQSKRISQLTILFKAALCDNTRLDCFTCHLTEAPHSQPKLVLDLSIQRDELLSQFVGATCWFSKSET